MSTVSDPNPAPTADDAAAGQPRRPWLVERGLLLERGAGRDIATAMFVNMLGNGLMSVSAVLFYTQVIGFSVAKVSLGVGLGTLVGMFGGPPIGRLADRRGPREIYLVTLLVEAAATASLVLVRDFWSFVLVLTVGTLAQAGSGGARGPIVNRFGGARQAQFRAYLRSAVNLSASIGLLLSALAIQVNTRTAYTALILANAVTFVATAAILLRLPHVEPAGGSRAAGGARKSRRTALRDRPYLAFTALNAITSFQLRAFTFALPLWIVFHTHAPRWLIGTSLVIGTVMTVVLQVRMTKGVDSNDTAARVWRRSGWALLVGMGLIGSSSSSASTFGAGALIVLGTAVMTVGEIQQAAGCFHLRVSLAPDDAQGEYTGVFNMGAQIANVVAPAVVGLFCVDSGAPGWWLLGGLFAACSLAVPGVVRWSDRTHQRQAEAPGPLAEA
ncbi:MFS family permease [Streptacidiphilus sp. MAP12-33]|uniref:MFS transporter n=1 Tax=Streptacidiphilus sp. MAP12-33 TaxID=3156266 RepID=UPI0035128CD1